jgi:hypothetical protein
MPPPGIWMLSSQSAMRRARSRISALPVRRAYSMKVGMM